MEDPRRRIKWDGGESKVLSREWRGDQRAIESSGRRMGWKKRDVVGIEGKRDQQ